MAAPATYTKAGSKAATTAKLDKAVFAVEVANHQLLQQAYTAYLANGRDNLATTKTRGEVSGGGKKPWKQKGTGRARFGSSRVPIWRGGGITFGPTGNENYSKALNTRSKRLALRQALTISANAGKIKVIEEFVVKDGKTNAAAKLLAKIEATGRILIVTDTKDIATERAVNNLGNVKTCSANYLNVFDVLNADAVIVTEGGLKVLSNWLAVSPKIKPAAKTLEAAK